MTRPPPQHRQPPPAACEQTALHLVCDRGDLALAKLLIEHGAAVNVYDAWGFSPLHYATEHEPALAKLLLDQGADVNGENMRPDMTPLDIAISANNTPVIELLKAAGGRSGRRDEGE